MTVSFCFSLFYYTANMDVFKDNETNIPRMMSAISMISCFPEKELTDLRNGQGETDKASDGQYHSQHLFDFPERKYLR